jgi:hypothetical protein
MGSRRDPTVSRGRLRLGIFAPTAPYVEWWRTRLARRASGADHRVKAILANQGKLDKVLTNQKTITANQAKILSNQKKILSR